MDSSSAKYGLTTYQAEEQLKKYGSNELPRKQTASALDVLVRQIRNPLAYLLLGAIILSLVIGDKLDSFLIGIILVLNVILGFWQEYKASRELEALRKFEIGFTRVYRDNQQVEIPLMEIVPDDVVILEPGDKVPADGLILESYSLQINESILTGESLPIFKSTKDGENLVFFGTTVSSGRAKIKITGTGSKTKFGSIAESLSTVEEEQTPLEKTLANLSKWIGFGALAIALIIFILRISQGFEVYRELLTGIALMVAVVPEGLPSIVTIVLALGVRRMYQKKALVRKMVAVESLGSATVILSDKTGTLTKNVMKVKEAVMPDSAKKDLLTCAVLCNSANLVLIEDPTSSRLESGFRGAGGGDNYDILGDITEGALLLWAKEQKVDIDLLRSEGSLVEEIPFSLETRKMAVIWQHENKKICFTKGAPEILIAESNLSEKEQKKWEDEYQKMAKKGLRILAFSKDKQFLGLVGIADEIRPEVKDALNLTRKAGIKVVMITGDNELTAKAIGEEIGLLQAGDEVLTGPALSRLSDEEFLQVIGKIRIFARITPGEKFRLVKAYQSLGEVVAVTGDGVNDALALKQADVGVSMGKIGTDVAKEASDIVLLDDNFATLVTAVEQGRLIYSNILKVVKFLLTGNLSEVLLIGFSVILGLPSPLLPVQILWINFVTDGPPALALGFDTPSYHLMEVPPQRRPGLFDKRSLKFIISGGITISAICFAIFFLTFNSLGLMSSRAITFSLMVVLQMILPFVIRRHHSVLSNKRLFISIAVILLVQILIVTYPPLRAVFKI